LLYSTYLGSGCTDKGHSIAVDGAGNAYVTGETNSTAPTCAPAFYTTPGAFETTFNGAIDAFVVKINPAQPGLASLLYSTYLGGSRTDIGYGITVDTTGNAYVTGTTSSSAPPPTGSIPFPTTPGAFETTFNGGSSDAFVTQLDLGG